MNDAELENLRRQLAAANLERPSSRVRKLLQTLTTKLRRREVSLSATVARKKSRKDPAA